MRILHVSHRFAPCIGGVETHVMQLCEQLIARGKETAVVCLNKCPNSNERLPAAEKISGIKVRRIGFLDLGLYKIAPGVLRELKGFDVVHVHGMGFFSDFLAITKFLHGKRIVLSTHGGIFHTGGAGLLKKIYFFGWCRLVLRAFDRVIAVSEPDFETFAKILPKKKLLLIENPVDIGKLSRIGGKKDPNAVLFVGRLSKNKGLPELLRAFAAARKKVPSARLKIIGGEFDLGVKELEKKAKELGIGGCVEVAGSVSGGELLRAYAKGSVFASASEYEGFGISAIEAMAGGLIPVLNGIPAFRRFVRNGENGFITDFSDGEKAGQAIAQAVLMDSENRGRIASAARESAKKFGWNESTAKFLHAYRR